MQTDSQFVIGQAHVSGGKPCQDYALTGAISGGAFAIVSDGCSSGGQTDVGARIVALATSQAIRRTPGAVTGSRQILIDAAADLYGCQQDDLLATCIFAVASGRDSYVHVQGDGVVAMRQSDGTLFLVKFDWVKNAPAYPAYASDDFSSFRKFYADVSVPLAAEWWQWREGRFSQLTRKVYSLEEGITGVKLPVDTSTLDCLALFTDGVTQVENVDWKDAVLELLNFKTTGGAFAKRRLNRFVKDAHREGHGPIDDLAYAVILF